MNEYSKITVNVLMRCNELLGHETYCDGDKKTSEHVMIASIIDDTHAKENPLVLYVITDSSRLDLKGDTMREYFYNQDASGSANDIAVFWEASGAQIISIK
ncbi:hypothetical protein F164LOC_20780 [Pectobacterium carotovorum]|uniref:hypothetical protein n=1 Tax=Pectobacterium versatile TaxID=2488639 RepID=UPI000C7F750D|nr:hypothetical protein [Pectobacterium versatile]PLY35374.1 hypothetical protein F164LOC_20780 [Pectobacterium carotovorum]